MIYEALEELTKKLKEFDKTDLEKRAAKGFLDRIKEEFNRYEVELLYENEYKSLTKDGLSELDISPKITYELKNSICVHSVDAKINKIPKDTTGFSINVPLSMFDIVKITLEFYFPEYLKRIKHGRLRLTQDWKDYIAKKNLDPEDIASKLTHPGLRINRIDNYILSEAKLLEGGKYFYVTFKYGGQLTPDDF